MTEKTNDIKLSSSIHKGHARLTEWHVVGERESDFYGRTQKYLIQVFPT